MRQYRLRCLAGGGAEGCPPAWSAGTTTFDFTNADARAFFTTTALRLDDHRVDGFFFDDVEGLGTEHGALIKTTGLTPDQVAAWNAARLPVYAAMHKALAAAGKFEWHMFVDADGAPVRTIGAMSIPSNTTCSAWMRRRARSRTKTSR